MTDDDEPKNLPNSWAHLFPGPDRRTPEERAEASRREYRRRHGGNRNWWRSLLPANDPDYKPPRD